MKYIIKNCPNYWYINRAIPECGLTYKVSGFKSETETCKYCKDISDCLLKQIVKKCKYFKNKIMQDITYKKGADMVENEILNILEIEEVDE